MTLNEIQKRFPMDSSIRKTYDYRIFHIPVLTEDDQENMENNYPYRIQLDKVSWKIFEVFSRNLYDGYLFNGTDWRLVKDTQNGWKEIDEDFLGEAISEEEVVKNVEKQIATIQANIENKKNKI